MTENDDGDVDRAKYRQLVRFLEEAAFAFEEGAVGKMSVVFKRVDLEAAYTDLFRSSLMALISIFRRPIVYIARACVVFDQTVQLTDVWSGRVVVLPAALV